MKRLAAIVLSASAWACAAPVDTTLTGYGEAIYVYASPLDGGRVSEVLVSEGDAVTLGQALFRLDGARNRNAAEAAELSASAARARAGAALGDAVARAQANASLARQTLERTRTLYERGMIAKARLDADRATLNAANAAVAQARAEQAAGMRDAGAAAAQARLAGQRLRDGDVAAPIAGRVERIYHRAGEVVGPGAPVLAILAPENMKIRFYAPQARLAKIKIGDDVAVACDGCPAGLKAKVSFIATEPQYTPPVLYDERHRDKLVYLVEARPSDPEAIRPGQPIDVRAP